MPVNIGSCQRLDTIQPELFRARVFGWIPGSLLWTRAMEFLVMVLRVEMLTSGVRPQAGLLRGGRGCEHFFSVC